MSKTILAVDIGFGSTKIAYQLNSGQVHYEKHVSAVAKISDNTHINDENSFQFDGQRYYLFDNATKLPSDKLMDIMSYEGLRTASPVILRYLLHKHNLNPDYIVVGLSLSMLDYSQDYKENLSVSLNLPKDKIRLVPQGVGCKVCYDSYGLMDSNTIRSSNYLGIDIGFNTVDIFQVINGSLSANTVVGLEKFGICAIANKVIAELKETDNQTIDIQEAKEIITTGYQTYRSEKINRVELVKQMVQGYFTDIISMIEEKYATTINKMDNLLLIGGGAQILKNYQDLIQTELDKHYKEGFLLIPKNHSEFYNVLGYYLIALKSLNQNDEK